MKGAYRVIVETRKVKYDFWIKRNITIFFMKTSPTNAIAAERRFGRPAVILFWGYYFAFTVSVRAQGLHVACKPRHCSNGRNLRSNSRFCRPHLPLLPASVRCVRLST